ncbi:MAG: bifunctional phosphopantothenoylcysteine decarboxylase/phosphopantothenate--cysteine ligase CoaBC [Saprospiraceae bacterium]|nr:bifunctional phosphopantothenoylcysteine decarboxylase/phosphopantothenate--cysteine ligase CoaBC [Saprospiraceae bacterium]
MSSLKGKKILLAVSGSIAAYKAAPLTRLLIKEGAEVKIVMTPTATTFITPLTLATLSKNEVIHEIVDDHAWNNHVELGLWADVMLVAPATATTLSKMASGLADNMVIACYLSAKCPVYFAPAMDLDMWKHPSTSHNIKRLLSYGNKLIPVGHGELASGLIGDGRMAEPEDIIDILFLELDKKKDLKGKIVIITAGPTYEKIDPVRFIGNHSSGKMGIALAEECYRRGAAVHLILGPSRLLPDSHEIDVHQVTSAQEMYEETLSLHHKADIAIMAAAVADYRPAHPSDSKIKKKEGDMSILLERTHDIAATIGMSKKDHQIHVGFALETDNVMKNAQMKLQNKNFDLIVLNSLKDPGAGFKHDTNKVTIISKDGTKKEFPLKLKNEVARDIVNAIVNIKVAPTV